MTSGQNVNVATKTIEDYFLDWERDAVGFGYGSGEPHTIPAIRQFLELCNEGDSETLYDYKKLESRLTPVVTWFLISILAKADVLEYGTSPRYAWLTDKGKRLKQFMLSRTADELVAIACNHGDDYVHCYPDACNCGENGYDKDRVCQNPFWRSL